MRHLSRPIHLSKSVKNSSCVALWAYSLWEVRAVRISFASTNEPRCISRLRHSTCPFCRNPFQGGTVVKLHVAPPGPSSSTGPQASSGMDYEKEKELDLLRRLALSLDTSPAPALVGRREETLRQLRGEVNQWLSRRSTATNVTVCFNVASDFLSDCV